MTTKTNIGHVSQIIGVVIDVKFDEALPKILNALKIKTGGKEIVLEVQQHVDNRTVRTISMSPTEGLSRGMEVEDTGAPISVPVGEETLGRMYNVIGEPIDGKPVKAAKKLRSIHQEAPAFKDQSVKTEILETGIKVIDLIAPIVKGGKVGLFGGAGVGKTVVITELIR